MLFNCTSPNLRTRKPLLLATVALVSLTCVYIRTESSSGASKVLQERRYLSFQTYQEGNNLIYPSHKYRCMCQSMFTIGACDMNQVSALNPTDAGLVSAVEGLQRARIKQDVLMMPHLQTLTRYLPPLFGFNATPSTNSSELNITANKYLSRTTQKIPFLPCQIHVYTPSEVLRCTSKYLVENGKPIRIAFVGDSRVRNTMQQMIRSTHHQLHYKHQGKSDEIEISLAFLDQKEKINIPVQSLGIELRLHWSAFLERDRNTDDVSQQGARDLLENWVSGNTSSTEDGPIPDVVYVTTGLWDTSMLSEDHAVESFIGTLEQMAPLLKALADKTHVLWHIHGPIKEWLATRDVPNGALDMMNRAAWRWLSDSNIWLWDSHTVMMLKQHAECQRLYEAGLHKLVPHEWGCTDFQHAGQDVEDAAANMLWNLVCNPVLKVSGKHCCS